MNTEMVQSAREREGQEIIESWEGVNPMGRIGGPHELQGAAVWMASDASSYLNGSLLCSILREMTDNPQGATSLLMEGTQRYDCCVLTKSSICLSHPSHRLSCAGRFQRRASALRAFAWHHDKSGYVHSDVTSVDCRPAGMFHSSLSPATDNGKPAFFENFRDCRLRGQCCR